VAHEREPAVHAALRTDASLRIRQAGPSVEAVLGSPGLSAVGSRMQLGIALPDGGPPVASV